MLVAEFWAKWLGIELNDDKRELPQMQTRHLGFRTDLRTKMLAITLKHRRRLWPFSTTSSHFCVQDAVSRAERFRGY